MYYLAEVEKRVYEGVAIVDFENIEEFETLKEVIENDEALENYLYERLEEGKTVSIEEILAWYNQDEDVVRIFDEAENKKYFIENYNLKELETLKEEDIDKNTIYLMRSYQYSPNYCLAKFVNFPSIEEVRNYIYRNELQYSDLGGNDYERLNNCYFLTYDKIDIDDITDILNTEDVEEFEFED